MPTVHSPHTLQGADVLTLLLKYKVMQSLVIFSGLLHLSAASNEPASKRNGNCFYDSERYVQECSFFGFN